MPVPHLEIRIVQRSKGSSAVAGAAYQAGEKLFSEYDQKMKNYLYKKEVVYTEVMLPTNAPPGYADRATLWNAAEDAEKQWNSQLARRFVVALPREVDGYQFDETEHKIQFEYINDRTPVIEYTLDLTNEKAPEKDTPETSENQEGSTPVSHSSDATSVSSSPKTGDNTNIAIFVLALAVSAGCLGTVIIMRKKRK